MLSRRAFLSAVSAVPVAGVLRPHAVSAAADIQWAVKAPLGLQLWSLRKQLPGDLQGTLNKVRDMGFHDVEAAGLYHHSMEEFRAALDRAGLRCRSAHEGFGSLRDEPEKAFADAKGFGAASVACAWIDHGDSFTREDALKAADVFNRAGKAAREAGLTLSYHCHGYEFVPDDSGTLFDTLAGATDPALLGFQIDVQHAFMGGTDPAALITRYASRVRSLHLKDLKKGATAGHGKAIAPDEDDVPVGSGQVDMPAVLRAASKAGVAIYFIEDESPDPLGHIPQSISYLQHVAL